MTRDTHKKQRRRSGNWLTAGVVIASSFLVSMAFTIICSRFVSGSTVPQWAKDGVAVADERKDLAEEQRLLVESVVAIIQNYYVDYERADNKLILATAARNLAEFPGVIADVGENEIVVRIDHETLRMPVPSPLGYDQLFSHMMALVDAMGRTAKRRSLNSLEKITQWTGAESVMNALLSGLDPHSVLLSPEAYTELRQGTEGAFGGLGVLVSMRDELLTVVKPLPRSPAMRAGIKREDKILKINDVSTFGLTLDDLVEHMRGEPGTEVQLSILRNEASAPEKLALTREIIQVDSVEQKTHADAKDILHLTIDTFSSKTSREVLNALKRFRAENRGRIGGLILDLRSNPGGLLDQAVQVADLFLESGVIVSTSGRREETEVAGVGYDEVDFPIVVLINEDSASASEIVAGALQDHERAVVVGQPSFGKGSVQTVFELPGERALKLTIARYYTPRGRSIQNEGIIPDVWLQPMAMEGMNVNLFGKHRYGNENFLSNHLQAVKKGDERTEPRLLSSSFAGLYEFSDEGSRQENARDLEFELAAKIIGKSVETYGHNLPRHVRRSSHWLALAAPEINAFIQSVGGPATAWLASKHGVSWEGSSGADPLPDGVELSVKQEGATLASGDPLTIHYELNNPTQRQVDHLSIYLTGVSNGFETQEVLVGRLLPGEKVKGVLLGKVPSYWEDGAYRVVVGLAKDALATKVAEQIKFDVRDKKLPELVSAFRLIEERGGKVNGMLEAGESAKLHITIRNDSKKGVRDLKLSIRNLGGKQIQLGQDSFPLLSLSAGSTQEYVIDLKTAERLVTDEIILGLMGDSDELKKPLRDSLPLLAVPNTLNTKAPVAH